MRIVTAHTLVEDLRAHFERAGFLTTPDGDRGIVVEGHDGRSPEELRAEVTVMLGLWRAMHPEAPAEAVD
jgi:hypothetical protein